jgi:hypothetical protein
MKPQVLPGGENGANNPYGITTTRNRYENAADTNPPAFASMLDSAGALKGPYRVDPNQSDAFRKMKGIGMSSDLSPWAALQMQQNDLSTAHQRDQTNAQAMGANDQAMQQLMTTGGGSNSGAAAFLASQGQHDNIMANQNIGGQAEQNALGIMSQDEQNKMGILGQAANTETGAQASNAGIAAQDTATANLFNANRYHEQMAAWGAEQTANGQAAAAGGGGKK